MVRFHLRGAALALAAILLTCADLPAAQAGTVVAFRTDEQPGTIVIRHKQRTLFLVRGGDTARRYPVAVGKAGKGWFGTAYIKGKYVKPHWSPPAEVRRDRPNLPDVIPGGSPRNPMGPRAILLDRDEIAIHGTNRPKSIGSFASYGCIRMRNADVIDLFERVDIGAKVVVTP